MTAPEETAAARLADARFEDGAERPLRLRAETQEDLTVISALLQDALAETRQAAWLPKRHRFSILLSRFRWEDAGPARRQGRRFERVQALLVVDGALSARALGIDPRDPARVVSLLALRFEPGEDGAGTLRLILAGDGEVAFAVECLAVTLRDVTRPYLARAAGAPAPSD
ncbi:DUF2948 family protein [soil metagenome]